MRGYGKKFWYVCCDTARRNAAHLPASGRALGLSTRRVTALSARLLSFSRRLSAPSLTSVYAPLCLDIPIHLDAVLWPLARLSAHIPASRRASVPRSTRLSPHLDAPLDPSTAYSLSLDAPLCLSTHLSVARRASLSLDAPLRRSARLSLGASTRSLACQRTSAVPLDAPHLLEIPIPLIPLIPLISSTNSTNSINSTNQFH